MTGFCIVGSRYDHERRRRDRTGCQEAEDQPVPPPALAHEPHRSGLGDQNRPHRSSIGRAREADRTAQHAPRESRSRARPAASSANRVMSTSPRSSTAAWRRRLPPSRKARSTGWVNSSESRVLGHKSFWVSLLDEELVDGAFATDHPFVRYALQPGGPSHHRRLHARIAATVRCPPDVVATDRKTSR